MTKLFLLPHAVRRDPAIEAWMQAHGGDLKRFASISDSLIADRVRPKGEAANCDSRQMQNALGAIAQRWFEVMRGCGKDVRETLHDNYPTACVGEAAFAYVGAFKAHVNVGFFRGVALADPEHLLEGTGKTMRHVKLWPGQHVDDDALTTLIETAYLDMKDRL